MVELKKTCVDCSKLLPLTSFGGFYGTPHAHHVCKDCNKIRRKKTSSTARAKQPESEMVELPQSFRDFNKEALGFLISFLQSPSAPLPVTIDFDRHKTPKGRKTAAKKHPTAMLSRDDSGNVKFALYFDYGRLPLVLEAKPEELQEASQVLEDVLAKNFLTFEVRCLEQLRTFHEIGF